MLYTKHIYIYYVATSSMEPTIPAKSIVLTIPAQFLKAGDIASYRDVINRVITHRIASIKTYETINFYTFKGDANKYEDPTPITQKEIIGKTYTLLPGNLWSNQTIVILIYIFAGFIVGKLLINFLAVFGTI